MRIALLVAISAAGKATLLAGPDTPIHEQKAEFKRLKQELQDGNDEVVELQLWYSSGGVSKRQKFLTSTQVAQIEAARKREEERVAEEAVAKTATVAAALVEAVSPEPPVEGAAAEGELSAEEEQELEEVLAEAAPAAPVVPDAPEAREVPAQEKKRGRSRK